MKTVFIAGHGRMYTIGHAQTLPQGVTLKLAVPASYRSSGTPKYALDRGDKGVSTNILSGTITTYEDRVDAGDHYQQHWLCPDGDNIMAGKGYSFKKGNWGLDYYLLQSKNKSAVSLSNIVTWLIQVVGSPLEVFWTCCRSPIQGKAIGKKVVRSGSIVDAATFSTPTKNVPAPGVDDSEIKQADNNSLTLKQYGANDMVLITGWPGLNTKKSSSKNKSLFFGEV